MSLNLKAPFHYTRKEEFPVKLTEWIGEVFYDILPEYGYEVREEQIFTAYQIANAFCNKNVHFAEAGLGTGKTFAYLLTAIAYARFTKKPVVIACATTALQQQLAGPEGDINTLAKLLDLQIDARMAKDQRNYVCDKKVNAADMLHLLQENLLSDEIYAWLEQTTYGERSEMPLVPDRVWRQIGWDESMDCEKCSSSGFCKLVKAKEYYRPAKDLIIADHQIFFHDLWTREEHIDDETSPILPAYSAVIFDEGHKVILPAVMSAGQYIMRDDINNMYLTLQKIQEARSSLLSAAVDLEFAADDFFLKLDQCVIEDEHSDRLSLHADEALHLAAATFQKALDMLHLELQIEQELYLESIPLSMIQKYETQVERAIIALMKFNDKKRNNVITWVDQQDRSFWVVPRYIDQLLNKHLFQKELPILFSSATLSNEGDFSYFSRTLGLKKASHSSVGSSFDLENQVVVYLNSNEGKSSNIEQLVKLLKSNQGGALVLTNSLDEVRRIRKALLGYDLPFEMLWEDRGERGYLVQRFRDEASTVLVGASFWEGMDVPGEALTLLIIWQLPFPSLDPLIEVLRKEAQAEGLDPLIAVDYPEMGLKLKQGCGRLIRTKEDHGAIVIMEPVLGKPWEKIVRGALPSGARVVLSCSSLQDGCNV